MPAPKWLTPAGFLGTFTQGLSFLATGTNITLQFQTTAPDASFSVISGNLANGLNLYTNGIVYGTPFDTGQFVTSNFVVRAKNSQGLADRTFSMTVDGPRAPSWITPAGLLPVGPNLEYYVLNKNLLDIQLQASSIKLPKGQTLRYYIDPTKGQLPPGLTMDQTGRIHGVVNDVLQLDYLSSQSGGFDEEVYDVYPYDHVVIVKNVVQGRPEAITKIYSFQVVATDGLVENRRTFLIEVVDPQSLRADNTFIDVDTAIFAADAGYLIPPIWENQAGQQLAPSANLGSFRANNFEIIPLKVYDPYPFEGPVTYDWSEISYNPEIKLVSDSAYNAAFQPTGNLLGANQIYVRSASSTPQVGMQFQLNRYVVGAGATLYTISSVTANGTGWILGLGIKAKYIANITNLRELPSNNQTLGDMYIYYNSILQQYEYYVYTSSGFVNQGTTTPYILSGITLDVVIPDATVFYCGSTSQHPPGIHLDTASGELYGTLPYQPSYSRSYKFTIRSFKQVLDGNDLVFKDQIFQLSVLGDVETAIEFVSTSSLGVIAPGQVSELSVVAQHTNSSTLSINYIQTGGKLPNGLSLTQDGSIVGKVPFGNITTFDLNHYGFKKFTLDQGSTTIDQGYTFQVTANDVYLLGSVTQNFSISVIETTPNLYTSVYFKPLMNRVSRDYYRQLVQNPDVFVQSSLYRPEDPAFGVQGAVKMYLEYGLQEINLDNYLPAFVNYFKRKRFYFGDLKTAVAQDSNGNVIYEVIYLNIVDDQMNVNTSTTSSFTENIPNAVGPGTTAVAFYPDSVTNMQNAIESIVLPTGVIGVDNEFRPRFMQTSQNMTGVPLGFVKASVLCYCLPGKSQQILTNLRANGFDFKMLDFDIDRVYLDNTLDFASTKYIVFGTAASASGFYIVTEDYNPATDPNFQDSLIAGVDIDTEDGNPLTI